LRKSALAVLTVFILGIIVPGILSARPNDTLQTIKKAVKENPSYKEGTEVRWFKVLIQEDGKDKVRISLPIAIIELFMKHSHDRHLDMDLEDCDVNFRDLFRDLKKLGPMSMIEIVEDGDLIKVWLE